LPSGFYDPPQTVELSATGGEIRYTLDGGLPRPNSALYADPIGITATTVLRARVFEAGKPPGPVETRTYFIGETPGSVPYVSVVADPQILFGDQIGLYYNQHEPVSSSTYGLRDVYKGKDAPGSLEFFAPGGAPGFRVNGGFRMGGENNWAGNSQRAMNFALRGKYGDDAISYDLFPGSGIPVHTGLTLRDGGDTWAKDMLRDALWPLLAKDHMCADTADYRPSVVFINGAYWGIHNIRARWDDAWFFQNHRANPANVDHLLYGHVDSSSVSLGIEKGNSDDWLDLMNFLNTADLSLPENHAFVESRIDIDSFIDFVVAESYGINTSWPWNLEFWRERKPGAKWRWFLPDMDQTFRTSQTGTSILSQMLASERVLVRLKASTPFKHRLAQRFCAHVASTFKPSRIDSLIDGMKTEVDAEIPRHIARWAAKGGMSVSSRNSYIQGVKDFTASRDANVHAEIKSQLSLPASAVDLTLDLNISAGGRVLICGVPVEPGVIRMFPDIPFEIQAAPAPGYRFESWTGATGEEVTSLTLTGAAALTANFAVSDETVVGGTLAGDTTLDLPSYALAEDLIVPPGTTLVIGPGVVIRLPAGRNIRVQGALQVLGTAAQPVLFTGRGGASWGGVSFENPTAASGLSHLTIRQATRGYDPLRYPSAISGLNAELVMDHLDIDESEGPIFTRGGSTILRASRLHTPYTGDCINIKFATHAEVTDSVFLGNTSPDTDAIDYDGVAGGIIANNRIYRFQADNSDGVDIGEGCTDLIIEDNQIYYNADKGFSIGQGSTATIRRNLVVGCALGVGVKDSGSVVTLDQNTFVDCGAGVAAYEKNFGKGGGIATVRNTIFSKCGSLPVTVDPLSSATVGYSLSDSVILAGTGNLMADPRFVDPVVLNFELLPASPAINAGDPLHAPDPDGSRADIGARYQYAATDYPYTIGNTVVIEEILANSETASDWIELHNRTTRPIDIGGWFLSDSAADLAKYRIPAGTVIPGGGHLVFYEDLHFGAASVDPGRVTPFAINDVGESLYLTSAVNDQLTDYQSSESFGPSMPGESLGFYYKPSSDTWNFVPLATPTPGAPNSRPRVGPIVISEINYQPADHADAEYLELLNVSAAPVTLYDPVKDAAWRISDGVEYEFPAGAGAVVMQPGERLVLTKSLAVFNAVFTVPSGTRVSEWTAGRLSNSGEQLQLVRPAGLDSLNVRQFARVDRVNYDSAAPWPSSPAGGGTALTKIVAADYGNDFVNWIAATANPGTGTPGPSFASWASSHGLTDGTSGDGDGDGVPNLIEYALGTDPSLANTGTPVRVTMAGGSLTICHDVNLDSPEAALGLEASSNLIDWTPVETTPVALDGTRQLRCAVETGAGPRRFYRLVVVGQP
ncbi:MAG: lamin tail domain-containing protein, partial [Akkermansiaceae bacterium]|nr:lamin tail domain-containing protein [Akkermansiaceae bacterium]